MAEGKKSFVLYTDLRKNIEHLTREEKGALLEHLLDYVCDLNPILEDRLLLTAWKPIEAQLKRDLIKFEEVKQKRSAAGKVSAEQRAFKSSQQSSTNSTHVESVEQTSTNPTVTVTVNDTVTVNVNDNESENVITPTPSKINYDNPEVKAIIETPIYTHVKTSLQQIEFEMKSLMQWRLDTREGLKINDQQLDLKLKDFIVNLKMTNEHEKPNYNWKSHFIGWYKRNFVGTSNQPQQVNQPSGKKHKSMAEHMEIAKRLHEEKKAKDAAKLNANSLNGVQSGEVSSQSIINA
jgi:hypothetical protein